MPNGHTQEKIENYADGPVPINAHAQHLKLLEKLL